MKSKMNITLSSDLYRANLLLKNNLQKELKAFDITTEQWTILKELYYRFECDKQNAYNQKDLALKCVKDQAALTRTLDLLVKKGLVKREKSMKDRREFLVFITDEGISSVINIMPIAEKITERLNEIFVEEEMHALHNLLSKLINSLDK